MWLIANLMSFSVNIVRIRAVTTVSVKPLLEQLDVDRKSLLSLSYELRFVEVIENRILIFLCLKTFATAYGFL